VGFLVAVELHGRFELFVAETENGILGDRQKTSKHDTNLKILTDTHISPVQLHGSLNGEHSYSAI
jgi:hypothetical protein